MGMFQIYLLLLILIIVFKIPYDGLEGNTVLDILKLKMGKNNLYSDTDFWPKQQFFHCHYVLRMYKTYCFVCLFCFVKTERSNPQNVS